MDAESGETKGIAKSPEIELSIQAPQAGWAEQDPEVWWEHLGKACRKLLRKTGISPDEVGGIGIAYQMHGLVLVDEQKNVLRPSIIWCDSRAVAIGDKAFEEMGQELCLRNLLNSPGNFTASKLRWVKENEPDLYEKAYKFMLPGDFIAMKMTGEILTTPSGLSEGIFWDFTRNEPSRDILDYYGIDTCLLPEIRPTCSLQGRLTEEAATSLGLKAGIPIVYRAGDQPNNALALNTLHPGQVAATGGTSGVVYGIVDRPLYDPQSRVNGFVHVNHSAEDPRIGVLLCINGSGIQYSWAKQQVGGNATSYEQMEKMASEVPTGSDGLIALPFGNGAERMLNNRNLGAQILNLHFNRHEQKHIYRAALEGVAFAFAYGMNILKEMGLSVDTLRVGNDNLFQSSVFSSTIATLMNCRIEVVETTGAIGAAKAAGVATGFYTDLDEATGRRKVLKAIEPEPGPAPFQQAYGHWENALQHFLNNNS